ncbi:hypothetical protein NLG97_g6963 [Lecanicillium saksenae]|uniref:Uncharacterized protein n=1 Tax=Lecanicillium saksenae TaxID=468837 RepID=A0ACC1QR76_9HYPO|nr:hypothetical protein NLG97_g6963 [Lecanicillium saksenae]
MRYEDWDILLFPRDGKVPLKEFKVACHVVHDNEFSHLPGSPGLPTVCCFVPSLAPGAPYKLSIHSWSTPSISQSTRSYGKFADRVIFQVRLFVDGAMVSSVTTVLYLPQSFSNVLDRASTMHRVGPWPNVLKSSFDISGTGELDPLSFPAFQRELLNQSYWSPADDLGRIKVVISQGYTRESTMTFERLKNVVAFSFQHAPLEILESSAIAWPNSSMWRSMPFTASTSLPTRQFDAGRSHAHSPRPRNSSGQGGKSLAAGGISDAGYLQPVRHREEPKASSFPFLDSLPSSVTAAPDPFVDSNVYFEWINGIDTGLSGGTHSTTNALAASRVLRKSSTDISMPDYVSWTQTPPLLENQQEDSAARISSDHDATHMKVPTNTPTACNLSAAGAEDIHFTIVSGSTPISVGLVESGDSSLLSHSATVSPQLILTPTLEVKSRKENKAKQASTPPPVSATISITGEPVSVRKVSQQLFKASGLVMKASPTCESPSRRASAEKSSKRVRTFTPASSRVFEDDEEPRRASPRVRLSAGEDAAAQ